MSDDPRMPVLRRVVHTAELPVEVECEHKLRIWHDDEGSWCTDLVMTGLESRETSDGWRVQPRPCAPPDDPWAHVRDGTLRICELVPVDEHEVEE